MRNTLRNVEPTFDRTHDTGERGIYWRDLFVGSLLALALGLVSAMIAR